MSNVSYDTGRTGRRGMHVSDLVQISDTQGASSTKGHQAAASIQTILTQSAAQT